MDSVDCAVVGAGVVGLAIARELALAGREVLILEAESAFGTHTSSRNSEVIHAGISYPAGSLKARLCVEGKELLYRYCAERGLNHRRIGKIIVATKEEDLPGLRKYIENGVAAGVTDLRLLSRVELRQLEPDVTGLGAVISPSTGIVDSHALMLALLGDAENAGASLLVKSPVLKATHGERGIVLQIGGVDPVEVLCRTVINSAGLGAHKLAGSIENAPALRVPRVHYARGRYYSLSGSAPFRHLVYPVSRESSLRVHVTVDLAGQCRFGPDLHWISDVDYQFDDSPQIRADFYAGIRRYYPALADGTLQPSFTGIRPRLAGPDDPLHSGAADFRIEGFSVHGIAGLVNLFGIESPGLTSCLAIARYVRTVVDTQSVSARPVQSPLLIYRPPHQSGDRTGTAES